MDAFAFSRYDLTASLGEFFGTAYFVFFGVGGSVALTNNIFDTNAGVGLIAGPIAWGFSLLVNVWIWDPISGGVLNPAITIALMVLGQLKIPKGLLYIVAEFLGALVGAYLISISQPSPDGGATVLADGTSVMQALLLELFSTSILTFTVLILTVEEPEKPEKPEEPEKPKKPQVNAAICIGWALFISAIAAGPYTGGSLNPARTFGPAIVTGEYGVANWIYYVGPVLGALLATGYWFLFTKLEYRKMPEYSFKKNELPSHAFEDK